MMRDTIIKNFKSQFNKNCFLNHYMNPLTKMKYFFFTTKSERIIELERNTRIDKIMKHKNFVNYIL